MRSPSFAAPVLNTILSYKESSQNAGYGLLNSEEFNERVSSIPASERELCWLRSPLKTLTTGASDDVYPAFQLDARLNHFLLSEVREIYRIQNLSEFFVWDFLRTRHTFLGGKTGVDYLLGDFSPEISAMTSAERDDIFLDLLQEEIGRLLQ